MSSDCSYGETTGPCIDDMTVRSFVCIKVILPNSRSKLMNLVVLETVSLDPSTIISYIHIN
jgi:hypothetical protein